MNRFTADACFRILLTLSSCLWAGFCSPEARAAQYQVYFGHVHNHSNVSDGKGSPERAYSDAQHVAGLDFFGLSDHAERMNTREWEKIKSVANARNQEGVFVTFWGFEWSHHFHGHVTVIQTEDYTSARKARTNSFAELLEWVSARDAVAFFNHPGRQDKTGAEFSHFSLPPSPRFVGIDLFNKIDGFEQYYYNDGYRRNDCNKGYYDEALSAGWRVGAAGSDDNHQGTWGSRTDFRLAVLASAKSRSAITEAMVARRFYATLDKNLTLSFEICGRQMGSAVEAGGCESIIRAADDDKEVFEQIMLIKNGSLHRVWHPSDTAPTATARLSLRPGEYYYVKVTQADGDEAISSPIWVHDPTASTAASAPAQTSRQ
jgi:hypothetical protein